MKKAILFVLTAALVAPAAFAGGSAEPSIRTANARLKEIVLSGKADAMTTDFYAPGAVLLPPNGPMVTGEENIQALWNGFPTLGQVTPDITADIIQETGDRPNHVQTTPESHEFYIRDVLLNWDRDDPNHLAVDAFRLRRSITSGAMSSSAAHLASSPQSATRRSAMARRKAESWVIISEAGRPLPLMSPTARWSRGPCPFSRMVQRS